MPISKINLTSGVTGTMPVANGGTGLTSGTANQFLKFTGSTTLASAADNAGKTLQVKEEKSGGSAVTLGQSYSDIVSLNFTPLESNSSLVIIGTVQMYMLGDASYNSNVRARYHNATDDSTLSASTIDVYQGYGSTNTYPRGNVFPSMLWYGSHWGTAQKTIKIQCKRPEAGGSAVIDQYNGRSRLIIMEIAT